MRGHQEVPAALRLRPGEHKSRSGEQRGVGAVGGEAAKSGQFGHSGLRDELHEWHWGPRFEKRETVASSAQI